MIDLGLSEKELRRARRREFPEMLRNLVADGATTIYLTLDAETALRLADDVELAVAENAPATKTVKQGVK